MDFLNFKQLEYDTKPLRGKQLLKRYIRLMLKDWNWHRLLKKYAMPIYSKQHYISVCAIFKDEAPYMREWLEYHLLMGVNHFYLYNNNSTDNYEEILRSYIENGIVTLTEWPNVPGQLSAYTHFYTTYRHESNWVSFLDLDEFICPRFSKDIPTWLEDYKQYPIIMMYWKMFGTSGMLKHDDSKLVTEQYTVCWEKLDTCGKLIWNTDYDIKQLYPAMMHSFDVLYNGKRIPPINVWKKFVDCNIHRVTNIEPSIQVNHYWSKAFNNYELKHKKGSAVFGKSWKTFDKFLWHENHNISVDYTIFRFLIQLKLRLNRKI